MRALSPGWCFVLVCALSCGAQEIPSATDGTDVHAEMARLVAQDVRSREAADTLHFSLPNSPPPPVSNSDRVLEMSAYVVHAGRIPLVNVPHYQTPFMKLMDTGLLYLHVGPRITSMGAVTGGSDGAGGGKIGLSVHLEW